MHMLEYVLMNGLVQRTVEEKDAQFKRAADSNQVYEPLSYVLGYI